MAGVSLSPHCSQPFLSPLSCTLGPLTVKRVGNPVYLFENHWSQGVKCYFEGRPRPQISWYKRYSNLKTFNHTEEVETLQLNGIFKVTTTLHVPGREEFEGIYSCFGNNSLSSGWSSSKEPKYGIELVFRCKQSLSSPVANNWQFRKGRQQRQRLGQGHKSLIWLVERWMNTCVARSVHYDLPNEVLTTTRARGTKFLIFAHKLSHPSKEFYFWPKAV